MAATSQVRSASNEAHSGPSEPVPTRAANAGRVIRNRYKKLLKDNNMGIIANPVQSVLDLMSSVQTLHEEYRLASIVDLDLLKSAANILLEHPDLLDERVGLDQLRDISQVDVNRIKQQRSAPFYRLPKEVIIILVTCSFGALTQGWDQQSIAGANLDWPRELLHWEVDENDKLVVKLDDWRFAAVNAITYFAASVVGSLVTDPLNQHFSGRRGALLIAGLFSFSSVIGSAYSTSWRQYFATRFLLGIGMGAKSASIPIYESEILPANRRGLLIGWQILTATGVCCGAAANIVLKSNWRWQSASGFIPAVPLLVLAFCCTESPRWLMQKGRYKEAYEALLRLRLVPILAATEFLFIHYQNKVEKSLFYPAIGLDMEGGPASADQDPFEARYPPSSWWKRVHNLFTFSRNRRACLAVMIVMISQQTSGINVFAFIGTNALYSIDKNEDRSLWLSFGFGLANTIFSTLAFKWIETKGRRFLLLLSIFGMIWTLIATALSVNVPGLLVFWLIAYVLCYSPGAGVVPFLYSSEVFPNDNREVGMSFAVFFNFLGAGLLTLLVPWGIAKLKLSGVLGIFCGLNVVAFILVWLFVPSTTEVTALEDMSYIFGVPTKEHVRYQAHDRLEQQVATVNNWIPCLPPREVKNHGSLYKWHKLGQRPEEIEEIEVENGEPVIFCLDEKKEAHNARVHVTKDLTRAKATEVGMQSSWQGKSQLDDEISVIHAD